MKTNIKRRYQTVNRKNQKSMWKLLLAVTLGGVTAILSPFALDVLYPQGNSFPQARVVKQEVKAERESYLIPREENETIPELIKRIADEMNFEHIDYLLRLAKCESGFNPLAVNDRNNNPKHSKDRGLFQLNDYWHKNITDAQAFDPEFATRWTIEKINKGGQGIWVCDKHIKANPNKYR